MSTLSRTGQQPRLTLEEVIKGAIAAETKQICHEEGEMAARRVRERVAIMAERVTTQITGQFRAEFGSRELSVKVTYEEKL